MCKCLRVMVTSALVLAAAPFPKLCFASEPTSQGEEASEVKRGATLSFGKTKVGVPVRRSIEILNTDKSRPTRITSFQMRGGSSWALAERPGSWIPPGKSWVLTIVFLPLEPGVHKGSFSCFFEREPPDSESEDNLFTFNVEGEAIEGDSDSAEQLSSVENLADAHNAMPTGSPNTSQATAPLVEIDFCQLRPHYVVLATNTSFSAVYTFEVGRDGAPENVGNRTRITREDARQWGWPAEFITPTFPTSKYMLWEHDEAFSFECISSWRLRGVPQGTKITAEFKWNHNFGWESLHVAGEGINYVIKSSGRKRNDPY
jgi:hypothetical protein